MKFHTTISITFSLAVIIFLSLAPQIQAQGIIIEPDQIVDWVPPHPIGPWPVEPITLESHSVQVELDDQFAHITTTQIFRNNTGTDLEGIYVFPVPRSADISDFSLWLDGRELNAETLEADQAARIYQDIVSTMRDPGLLEYVGDGMIQAHIYPIPAYGTKQIDMEYDWLIPIDNDLMRIEIPLKLEGYSIDRIESLVITVDIDSPDALGTIYSPTHDVTVDRRGARRATASFEKSSNRPDGNFILYISRPGSAIGLNMLTHATGSDEGYFLAMIAPEYDESRLTIVPKDFVCVLDTSGSMSGGKIEQAKEALDFIFRNLNSDDRFQLITFATDIYPYFHGWSEASSGNIRDVRDHISGLNAGGSTNINAALAETLSYEPDRGRPMYVIFLTDGLPTVGETNTDSIFQNVVSWNSEVNARIFCFGVGNDVDYEFIDLLSRENGGYTANVAPDENLEQPLSDFYAKIKSPVMTDIEVEIDGTRIYDMLPVDLPDLFLGTQLILTGRYNGTGSVDVRLTGLVGDDDVRYSYPVNFTDDRDNDFIPRHWATRRVGYLLNQGRLYGENEEIVDEIIDLAQRYGIITPYTSMLVTEDEVSINRQAFGAFNMFDVEDSDSRASGALDSPSDIGSHWGDIGQGTGIGPSPDAARMESEDISAMEWSGEAEISEEVREVVRYSSDKTFYLNDDGYWVDSEFPDSELEPIYIVYLSDEYFQLVMDEEGISDYISVGEYVILVWDDVAYQIGPDDGEVIKSDEAGIVGDDGNGDGSSSDGKRISSKSAPIIAIVMAAVAILFFVVIKLRK